MKPIVVLLLGVILLSSSCKKAKNNRAERKLEGTWELVKSEYGDNEVDLTGREHTLTFYDSNSKDYLEEEMHYGVSMNSYEGHTYYADFKYFASEKGKELNMYIEFNSPVHASIYSFTGGTIKKLNSRKFILEGENADGFTSKFTYERKD
jgi:hypothetical protein